MPRGLTPPDPPLADDVIRLTPLAQSDVPDMLALAGDAETIRFTRVPVGADASFVGGWIGRYEQGWADAGRAGFSVRDHGGMFLGFAAFDELELEHGQGEIGYVVVPAARGRGVATRAVGLLTAWGLGRLGLERIELRIDPANTGSIRVAQRTGYRHEGVLRNLFLKDGERADVGVWSKLRDDPPAA